MATKILNKESAALHGTLKINEALFGLGYKKVVVVDIDDMSLVANNDVVYTLPCIASLDQVTVFNYGTTAFAVATTCYLDESAGNNHLTDDIKVLAAGAGNKLLHLGDAIADVLAAGTQILWDLGGANSSLATAKGRVIIEYTAVEDVNI